MNKRILIAAGACAVLAACIWGWLSYLHNKDFTPWMDEAALNAHLDGLTKKKGPNAMTYWQYRHWIYAVEGRLRHGVVEYRVKYGDAPNYPQRYQWYWNYSLTKEDFDALSAQRKANGFKLAYENHFKLADGKQSYQAVWQRLE